MHGPIAATIAAGSAPSRIMAATVASITPADRAAPAGMGGADHAGLGIGQQDGRAVGGDDAESDIGAVRHHRVGARAVAGSPRCRHLDHVGAVHLHEADEAIRVGADRARRRGRGSPAPRRARRRPTGCS